VYVYFTRTHACICTCVYAIHVEIQRKFSRIHISFHTYMCWRTRSRGEASSLTVKCRTSACPIFEKWVPRRGQWEQCVCCSSCGAVRVVQCACCSAARAGLTTSQALHVLQGVCCRVCVAECVLQCAWCTKSIYQLVQLSRELCLRCNTQQHIAPHCNTLQHTAAHCNTLQVRVGLGYGVATTSKLLKITGLFSKRAQSKRRYSAKETYNFNIWMHPYVARGEGSEGTQAV